MAGEKKRDYYMNPRSELPSQSQIHDRSCLAGGGHRGNVVAPQSARWRNDEKYHCFSLLPDLLRPSRILLNLARIYLARKPGNIVETEQEMNLLTYSSAVASEHSAYYTVDI